MPFLNTIKSIDIPTFLNYFINFITIVIIIYSIYRLYNENKAYNEFDSNHITKPEDLEIISEKYTDCNLYKYYNSLTEIDKEYLEHLINYAQIKYKNNKPIYNKKLNSYKTNIFFNVLITLLIKQNLSSGIDTFKHNLLLTNIT